MLTTPPAASGSPTTNAHLTLTHALTAANDWPLPGSGRTLERWSALARLAERDLVLARLAEAHADALAILSELHSEQPPPTCRWGVWAAEVPGHTVSYDGTAHGAKAWCSGATLLTHALVTAAGGLLLAVGLDQASIHADPDTWAWAGMRAADTRTVRFDGAVATVVGTAGEYLSRPGFWLGGVGVAACWYGGAAGLAAPPAHAGVPNGRSATPPPTWARLRLSWAVRGTCCCGPAALVDARPTADHARLARRVRGTVAQAASDVATHVGRALGPGPYVVDGEHAQRVADLEVYVRQDHAERDLAALGRDVAAAEPDWSL